MLATVAGLAVAAWTIGATGLTDVLATAARMGLTGFLAYCLWSLGVFFLLGAAWLAAAPGETGRSLPLFAWARMVREAVSDLLPFSQLGGIIVSARTLTVAALPSSRVHGSLVVDMTTEMASQLVYTLFGLALMGSRLIGDGAAVHLRPAILGGTLVMAAIMLLFFTMQRAALEFATRMAGRFLPGSTAMVAMRSELARIYARKDRVALAFGANLAAWLASGTGAWLALGWMGVTAPLWDILALESLIFTLRSVAFVIPGALGVQEAAYALAGPIFGLPPETALALSLAKRARDLAIGLPTLLFWQANEMRNLAGRGEKAG
ncbi:lysylphosphatidylglycerol synthase domain-containing protein [Sphingobium estronivorans]|uniref:lysylphosphatidylglycerol synthase domain-containing protein n=1 Tax=Sphingobium estronivorans TaxID=1577690 RepID=UPI00123BFD12|nr:lysylphosphatidylglycerol synthase domain-containing protein [Sphingobium estronivorans]